MDKRRIMILAGICLGVSIFLVNTYVNVRKDELTASFGDEVDVVVATKDIPEYVTITPDMLETIRIFKKYRQPQTVTKVDDLIGKATYVPIGAKEQVTLTKLIQQDGRPVLNRQVDSKKRAITLLIAPHTGVGRLVRPGNRVDIIAAPTYDFKRQRILEVKTVIQNALVLATGKRIQNEVPTRVNANVLDYLEEQFDQQRRKDFYSSAPPINRTRPDDNYAHLTLQISIVDAEKLLYLTSNFGDQSLYFVLRNGGDDSKAPVKTTLLDDILGADSDYARSKRRAPPAAKRRPRFYDNSGGKPVPVY